MNTKNRYYLDMDGVLVEYGINDYTGDDPVWLKKNTHYYLHRKPDYKMLKIADMLNRHCEQTNNELYILTSLPVQNAIFNEHFHDKIMWLNKFMPYINIDHILISATSKRDAVEYILDHDLSKYDILIDDYNKNLNDWRSANGTAIKYCNNINDPKSFDGIRIYQNDPASKSIDTITQERN